MVSCAGQVGQAREHRIRVKMGLQLEKFIYHQHHRVDVGVSMSSSSSAELEGFDDTERLGFRIPTMSLSIPTYPPDQMLTDPVIISAQLTCSSPTIDTIKRPHIIQHPSASACPQVLYRRIVIILKIILHRPAPSCTRICVY